METDALELIVMNLYLFLTCVVVYPRVSGSNISSSALDFRADPPALRFTRVTDFLVIAEVGSAALWIFEELFDILSHFLLKGPELEST